MGQYKYIRTCLGNGHSKHDLSDVLAQLVLEPRANLYAKLDMKAKADELLINTRVGRVEE